MAFAVKPLTARPMGASLAGMLGEEQMWDARGDEAEEVKNVVLDLSELELRLACSFSPPFSLRGLEAHLLCSRFLVPFTWRSRGSACSRGEQRTRTLALCGSSRKQQGVVQFRSTFNLTLSTFFSPSELSSPQHFISTARRAVAARPAARRAGVVVS